MLAISKVLEQRKVALKQGMGGVLVRIRAMLDGHDDRQCNVMESLDLIAILLSVERE